MKTIIPNYVRISGIISYKWNLAFDGEGLVINDHLWFIGPFTTPIQNTSDKNSSIITFDISGIFFKTNLKGCMYFIIIDLIISVILHYW